jgi:hypothetical protein
MCAGLALAIGAADAKPARPLLPPGGLWQSIPYAPASGASEREPTDETEVAAPQPPATAAKTPIATKTATRAPAPKTHSRRHPVAAAAVSEPAPPATAAARTKELERRLDVLMPGARLGEAVNDPYNPAWRRARPGRAAGEHNTLSVPLDEKGQSGFVARGYHAQPDVQNPHGNTGATFGVRTRF